MSGTHISNPWTAGLSGNVQKHPMGKGATLVSEIDSLVFIRQLLDKRQKYPGILPFLVSEEDKIQFGSVLKVTQFVN